MMRGSAAKSTRTSSAGSRRRRRGGLRRSGVLGDPRRLLPGANLRRPCGGPLPGALPRTLEH
eukprot:12901197-Prorocentrum_lima.AAC.1